MVNFTPRPLYPRHPLDRRLGGHQSRSERGGQEENFQPPPGIEPQTPMLQPVPKSLNRDTDDDDEYLRHQILSI
jgi:hypothetical protein